MVKSKLVITIDGTAGSGKSTTARLLAKKFGYLYLDTGAMYRAVTLKVIQNKLKPQEKEKVVQLLNRTDVTLKQRDSRLLVLLDDQDVSESIRSAKVDKEISWVCQIPEVRKRLVELQQQVGKKGGIIADGRDMGTVVFPQADLKFYLNANVEERGRRRWQDMRNNGDDISLEEVITDLKRRDKIDSEREISPLKKAEDAIEVDTSNMTIEQQVEFISVRLRNLLKKRN